MTTFATRGYSRPSRAARPARRRGFTLIETALATIIVGVGVLAIVSAQQAFHKQNYWSSHAGIAERLGNEIREMTLNLPRHDPVTGNAYWGWEPNESTWVGDFDDLDDFDGDGSGLLFSADTDPANGPINARREIIPNMDGWTQQVFVYNVDPFDITSVQADRSTEMIVVEVIVTYQGPGETEATEMTRVAWIAPN
jgi:prepilin-type N-terminal cleavage/methylation domain-containing protein